MNSKNDGNIIVNVNALRQSVNKSMICKECLESKIEQKMVDMLKYVDQVHDEFSSKVDQIPIRTQKGRREYCNLHKPTAGNILEKMRKRRSGRFSWLDDCISQPFNSIVLETDGIATSVKAVCECQQHVTEILPNKTKK